MIFFKKFFYSEKIIFLLCGGAAALINLSSRFILSFFLNLEISIIIAYLFGMLSAFYLFKNYVFNKRSSKYGIKTPVFFIFVNLIALVQIYLVTIGLNYFLIEIFFYENVLLSHGIAILSTFFSSFFLHKNYTYK